MTVLSPIRNDPHHQPSHAESIRATLACWGTGGDSPLARVGSTHFARITVIDDVFYQGHPVAEDHLKSKYLLFSSNFDGPLETYLDLLLEKIPQEVASVWSHCVNFPGVHDRDRFHDYFRKCQIENGIFFADYGESQVCQILTALHLKQRFAQFVAGHQGKQPAALKREFDVFLGSLGSPPSPGNFR